MIVLQIKKSKEMKKIAFMFAAAAMFVACDKAKEVTLTAEDSLAVKAQVMEALNAEIGEAPVMDELAEDATEEMKAAAQAEFDSLTKVFEAKTAEVMATKEAKEAEALAAALQAKKDAAQGAEKAAEGEKK